YTHGAVVTTSYRRESHEMSRDTLHKARQLQQQVEERWARLKGKKNAVLHLRIETELMERIKAEAAAHKLSLSDFVRLRLVEGLGKPVANDRTPDLLSETTAWSEAVVMHAAECALCGVSLGKGARAWLAHGPPPPARM